VGARGVAVGLGKPGTVSDLSLFNRIHNDRAITIVEPTKFPEKFAALLFALAMGERSWVAISGIDREIGETLAVVDLFERPTELKLGESVGEAEVRKILKGLTLEAAPIGRLDLPALRSELDEWTSADRPGPVRVPIDHAFPVKGVGAVALGVVEQGALHVHDKLELYPTGRTVEVRSIQVHDVDVREAKSGDRVGMALKGVEAEELERGQIVGAPGALTTGTELSGDHRRSCGFYRGKLTVGSSAHALVGLQFVPIKISAWDGADLRIVADRPVSWSPQQSVLIADLSVTSGPRIAARATLR
jgi:selenocysteine-specific translation elongation factor